jgi:thiamine-monophosphate kinase
VKLSEIGEFGLIARFSPAFLKKLPRGVVGIGDDCAVLPWRRGQRLLVTTDMLIEDSHFLRAAISPRDLGDKSMAVNLSDIASMGGRPRWAFLSLGIPADVEVEWIDEFFAGIARCARAVGLRLVGGDTTKSPDRLVINIAVLGTIRADRVKHRSGAKPGDIIVVTGNLGDSGGGLRVLLEQRRRGGDENFLVQAHHRPRAHLTEGAWLAARSGGTAMMDVSDGIDSDLHRIMERSRCGAAVDLERLPLSRPLRRSAAKYGWDPYEVAASGGEDYCLLATIAPPAFKNIATAFRKKFGRRLAAIGEITPPRRGLSYRLAGRPASLGRAGFDHFR